MSRSNARAVVDSVVIGEKEPSRARITDDDTSRRAIGGERREGRDGVDDDVSRRAGDVLSRELSRELRVRGDAEEGTARARVVRGALRRGDGRRVVREGRGGEDVGAVYVCVRARERASETRRARAGKTVIGTLTRGKNRRHRRRRGGTRG
tara:strand:- start:5673 stop:6125 length:453 start_codon:yes stop_codon:yes gene_type:complete